jgi:hypothetical protein
VYRTLSSCECAMKDDVELLYASHNSRLVAGVKQAFGKARERPLVLLASTTCGGLAKKGSRLITL